MKKPRGWSLTSWVQDLIGRCQHGLSSWRNLDQRMPEVNRAFDRVRSELAEVGLLEEGVYLDQIDLYVSPLPSNGEAGYVYEEGGFFIQIVGYEEGAIYLPSDLPAEAYVPGGTLTDTIRHEFGHAWHWMDPGFFDEDWFERAFSGAYDDPRPPYNAWLEKLERSRDFQSRLSSTRGKNAYERLVQSSLLKDFVSAYAATRVCEDFAETFMYFLRYRNSIDRFRKTRPGVHRKLKAIQKAVQMATRANAARGKRVLDCACPLHDNEGFEVPNEDGDWECPLCGETVTVGEGEAEHAELLQFTCPDTGKDTYVLAEKDEYSCGECGLDVHVADESDAWKVLHQVRVE